MKKMNQVVISLIKNDEYFPTNTQHTHTQHT